MATSTTTTPTVPSSNVTMTAISKAFNGKFGGSLLSYAGKHPSLPASAPLKFGDFKNLTAVTPTFNLRSVAGTNLTLNANGSVSGDVSSSAGSLSANLRDLVANASYNLNLQFQVSSGALPSGATLSSAGALAVSLSKGSPLSASGIVIKATNDFGNSATFPLSFAVTGVLAPKPKSTQPISDDLTRNTRHITVWNLEGCFDNIIGTNPTFSYTMDNAAYLSAIDLNYNWLTWRPFYRGAQFTVTVTVTASTGTASFSFKLGEASISHTIEPNGLASPTASLNVQYNGEGNTICLYDYFNRTPWIPNIDSWSSNGFNVPWKEDSTLSTVNNPANGNTDRFRYVCTEKPGFLPWMDINNSTGNLKLRYAPGDGSGFYQNAMNSATYPSFQLQIFAINDAYQVGTIPLLLNVTVVP